jgi:hypothetical protein
MMRLQQTPSGHPRSFLVSTVPGTAVDLAAWIAWLRTSDEKLYGRGRADVLEAMGSDLGDAPGERTANLVERGWNRLRLGDTDGALADLTEAVALAETSAPGLRERARVILASAWMRKAELDNCVSDGTGSACLVPFDTDGVHQQTVGMTEACLVLEDILLEDAPNDGVRRWLLNIGHMALGDYPDALPEAWLVPPSALASEEVMPPWHNVAATVGLSRPGIAGQANINDFDGDGCTDLMIQRDRSHTPMLAVPVRGDGTLLRRSRTPPGCVGQPRRARFTGGRLRQRRRPRRRRPHGAWMDIERLRCA